MKPIIGVTIGNERKDGDVYAKVNEWNLNAIIQNGGIPVMLPITNNNEIIDRYLRIVDGIFFTGGEDINPLIFGEEPILGLGNIEYDRDEFEMELYKRAAQKNYPMLGICRGMQLMNVAAGGTIYQDIYSQRPKTNNHYPKTAFDGNAFHTISIIQDTKLQEILGADEVKINSYHHQAVKDVAEGYKISAFAKDGIVECIESTNLNFAIGVQWHPEVMCSKYPIFANLFIEFINSAMHHNIK